MFNSLKNIQGAFALSRFYLIGITIFCLIISSYSVYKAFAFAELQREKIYVLDNGKSLMLALSQDVLQNRPSEAKSHVKRLHDLLFTIPPSFSTIEYNIDQALRISDNSVLTFYKNRSESGFYDKLVGAGIINEIKLDSINVNMNSYPYSVKTYATTSVMRTSSVTYYKLYTSCNLVNSARSDDNPHGFLIEKWKIDSLLTIKTVSR